MRFIGPRWPVGDAEQDLGKIERFCRERRASSPAANGLHCQVGVPQKKKKKSTPHSTHRLAADASVVEEKTFRTQEATGRVYALRCRRETFRTQEATGGVCGSHAHYFKRSLKQKQAGGPRGGSSSSAEAEETTALATVVVVVVVVVLVVARYHEKQHYSVGGRVVIEQRHDGAHLEATGGVDADRDAEIRHRPRGVWGVYIRPDARGRLLFARLRRRRRGGGGRRG